MLFMLLGISASSSKKEAEIERRERPKIYEYDTGNKASP